MPPLEYWRLLLWNGLDATLPWIVAAAAIIGIASWSPLGRTIVRALRERRRDAELTEEMLLELGELRRMLGDTLERLDATERRLSSDSISPAPTPRPVPPELKDPDRVITPH